jgi:hypothetical protein
MRSERIPLVGLLRGVGAKRTLARALELVGWMALLGAVEVLGRRLPATDIVALGLLVVVGLPATLVGVALARRGWLPLARAACLRLKALLERWGQRLVPSYELALRLNPALVTRRDRPYVASLLLLATALVAAVILGPRLALGLDLLRSQVSLLLQLLALGTLWIALLLILTAAFALEVQLVGLPLTALLSAFGLVAAALLPGYAITAIVLGLGLAQSLRLARRPLAPYLFCRHDPERGVCVVRAQTVLRRLHLVCTLGLALVVTLGNADRLTHGGLVGGDYAFTGCLGLLAALPAVLLMAHVDLHFGRLLCVRTEPPESPLVPTLWWDSPSSPPALATEVRPQGWELLAGGTPREDDFDLVAGPHAAGPRRLSLDPALSAGDREFARRRRFHVVHRRDFMRRFETLVKETRPLAEGRGTGFLFCPHLWLVPGLLRDAGGVATPVGRPFQAVFRPRLRRYLGVLLRALQVDVIFWEDAIGWADLRRVLGVAFECYDQGRLPLRARHFVGVPRVRVVIQEEDGPGTAPRDQAPGLPRAPVGSGARVLVILRDRGGTTERAESQEPSDRRPIPLTF